MSQDLFLEHKRGMAAFAYFQLGIAASAIAFAVHETSNASLSDTPWPIGVGVLLWAFSFAAGCFGVEAHQRSLATNFDYLVTTKEISQFGDDPEFRQFAAQARAIALDHATRPIVRFRAQLWMLFAGAVFFVAGHVMTMAERPSKAKKVPSIVITSKDTRGKVSSSNASAQLSPRSPSAVPRHVQ